MTYQVAAEGDRGERLVGLPGLWFERQVRDETIHRDKKYRRREKRERHYTKQKQSFRDLQENF